MIEELIWSFTCKMFGYNQTEKEMLTSLSWKSSISKFNFPASPSLPSHQYNDANQQVSREGERPNIAASR